MVVVSILPHAKFGRNDHREDAPHFIIGIIMAVVRCDSQGLKILEAIENTQLLLGFLPVQ